MNKQWKQVAAGLLAVALFIGMGNMRALAAGPYQDGTYTAKITMLKEDKDKPSMCNALFDQDADVKIQNGNAEVCIYAAFPVPNFSGNNPDGTVKNTVLTLDGVSYTADSDTTTKPVRTMDEKNLMFGIKAGAQLTTQVLTFTIPAEKLDSLASGTPVSAFVNVLLQTNKNFRLRLDHLQLVEAAKPEEVPETVTSQDMQLTASVGAPAASYTVTIPETVALGTLSAEKENVTAYTVDVTAENMGTGYVEVSAAASGELHCGENALAFTNSFGTQQTQETATLNGEFTVTAAEVKTAAGGNYTGTTDFVIRYFAGA